MVLFLYFFIGCKSQNSYLNNDQIYHAKIDTLIGEPFYNLNYLDSNSYIIEWGTSNFKNISKDTFHVLGNGSLGILEANSKYLALNQPCGTSCALYVILPLESNKSELTFWNAVYNNLDQETIITTKDPSAGIFEITNYGNTTHQEITLEEMCPAADKSSCIDSITMTTNKIIFYYQGNKWEHGKPDNRIKEINL